MHDGIPIRAAVQPNGFNVTGFHITSGIVGQLIKILNSSKRNTHILSMNPAAQKDFYEETLPIFENFNDLEKTTSSTKPISGSFISTATAWTNQMASKFLFFSGGAGTIFASSRLIDSGENAPMDLTCVEQQSNNQFSWNEIALLIGASGMLLCLGSLLLYGLCSNSRYREEREEPSERDRLIPRV